MADKHTRSIAKALSWRVIASLTTAIIVYVLTSSWELSVGAGILDAILKLLFYYLHERAWNRINWGTH